MTENEFKEMLKENALKIDETRLEKAHEIARKNYLGGKRDALTEVRAEIDGKIEGGNHCDEYIDGYEDGLTDALSIIDKHLKGGGE